MAELDTLGWYLLKLEHSLVHEQLSLAGTAVHYCHRRVHDGGHHPSDGRRPALRAIGGFGVHPSSRLSRQTTGALRARTAVHYCRRPCGIGRPAGAAPIVARASHPGLELPTPSRLRRDGNSGDVVAMPPMAPAANTEMEHRPARRGGDRHGDGPSRAGRTEDSRSSYVSPRRNPDVPMPPVGTAHGVPAPFTMV